MKDKLNITVRLADQPPIAMRDVTLAEEETIRQAEYNINRLWETWRLRFKDKSAGEILAMVTLRFAQPYYSRQQQMENLDSLLDSFERDLDRSLIDIERSSLTASPTPPAIDTAGDA